VDTSFAHRNSTSGVSRTTGSPAKLSQYDQVEQDRARNRRLSHRGDARRVPPLVRLTSTPPAGRAAPRRTSRRGEVRPARRAKAPLAEHRSGARSRPLSVARPWPITPRRGSGAPTRRSRRGTVPRVARPVVRAPEGRIPITPRSDSSRRPVLVGSVSACTIERSASTVEVGILWFWLGTHAEYDGTGRLTFVESCRALGAFGFSAPASGILSSRSRAVWSGGSRPLL
jgi:hypothetical protein